MPKCPRCGTSMWRIEMDADGLCESCRKIRANSQEQIRIDNYHLCRDHKAPPPLQRIYDAFIAKYPDALITGISIKDNGKRLLFYLDGHPSYYVTFNPLINSVELEKHVAPASPVYTPSEKKHSLGASPFIALAVAILFFFFVLSKTDSAKPSSSTPKVTAVPTATASLDDPVSWAQYYAQRNMPKDMTLDTAETSTSSGETYLSIALNMDVMLDGYDYVRSAAELICKVAPKLVSVNGFDRVTFLFYGPFIDKYGNDTQSLGIRVMYTREELRVINFDYFYNSRYSNPTGVFKAANSYLIHPSYLD